MGWNFSRSRKNYNADGASSLETLTSEKRRLELRLVDLPKQIAQLKHGISVLQSGLDWINSLSNMKRKNWEKDNGTTVENQTRLVSTRITDMNAQVTALSSEKARIPEQLSNVQKQLDALVKGEAQGLEKGLDKETARELGEMELVNEQEQIDHDRAIRQAQLEQQIEEPVEEKEPMSTGVKIAIGAGVLLILVIVGYMLYQRSKNKIVAV